MYVWLQITRDRDKGAVSATHVDDSLVSKAKSDGGQCHAARFH